MIAPHIAAWALSRQQKSNSSELHAGDIAVPLLPPKKRKKHERVLETKGGGGYTPPPQPSPQEQAAARDWEAQQEFNREQTRQAALDKQEADRKSAADAAWQSSKGAAYTGALNSGTSRLRGLGIEAGDPYGVYSDFTNRLNTANASLQTGGDYQSAFAPTILDEILGSARSSQRNKYTNQYNSLLPQTYAEDRFTGTSDDAILASILDQQYQDASLDLQSARARGQATQTVYDRALRDLETGKATANADLQNVGATVRNRDIENVNKRRDTSFGNIANWDFGTQYNPTSETGRVRSYADELYGTLQGDINTQLGGRELFDTNALLGKATARVGTTPTPTGGTTAGGTALQNTFQDQALQNTRGDEGIF